MKVGDTAFIPAGWIHRASSWAGGTFLEFAYGKEVDESDIIRLEDDYGRV